MSFVNQLPTDRCAIVGVIDPDAYTAATYTTGWVDASKHRRFMAVVFAGDLGSSATINAKLECGTTSSGGTTHDVTGAAITPLTQAGTDDNKQAIINLDTAKLQTVTAGTDYRYIRLSVTVGVATSDMGAVLIGFDPFNGPASDNDATTVDEIVSV